MGLDMFLSAKRYISPYDEKDILISNKIREASGETFDLSVKWLQFEAAYWRKSSEIHDWFVKNVQNGEDDCREYEVSHEELQELLNTVNKVLENTSLANELLPTTNGFFFGGVGYDQYYFDDLRYTKERLEYLLKNVSDAYWFTYRSSW